MTYELYGLTMEVLSEYLNNLIWSNTINSTGLILDIIGASILAWAVIIDKYENILNKSRVKSHNMHTGEMISLNASVVDDMIKQKYYARFGLLVLISGFLCQLLSNLKQLEKALPLSYIFPFIIILIILGYLITRLRKKNFARDFYIKYFVDAEKCFPRLVDDDKEMFTYLLQYFPEKKELWKDMKKAYENIEKNRGDDDNCRHLNELKVKAYDYIKCL